MTTSPIAPVCEHACDADESSAAQLQPGKAHVHLPRRQLDRTLRGRHRQLHRSLPPSCPSALLCSRDEHARDSPDRPCAGTPYGGLAAVQVMVDHSIYAPKVGVLANSRELPGDLLDVDGHTVRHACYCPCCPCCCCCLHLLALRRERSSSSSSTSHHHPASQPATTAHDA